MWWIAITLGLAALVVVTTRGDLARLLRLPFEAWWLLVPAVAIQVVFEIVDLPRDRIDDVGFPLLMASYALLLAFCLVNLRVRGIAIVAIGVALNTVVIGLNRGMPTRPEPHTTASGRTVDRPIERSVKHRPEHDNDLLPFLGDKIVLPDPIHEVLSPGDFVIAFGVIATCLLGSRQRRRTRRAARSSARFARAATRSERAADTQPTPILRWRPPPPRPTTDDVDPLGRELEWAHARLIRDDPVTHEPRNASPAEDDDQTT